MLQFAGKNAVAAIRVSTEKQGRDGDSPDAQKEQIDRFAIPQGMKMQEYFAFMESGSKVKQPMQPAIDYCKDPKNKIDYFIIKSIDRFTRGGSSIYENLKKQLDECGVTLIDTHGVISGEKVNTLGHLGFKYDWSVYSPSKINEMLTAERAKDELRDIMSRMIEAEIRYTQNGFWMRQPPYGFVSRKIETKHGKRCILKPHPTEAKYIIEMFELRAKGISDEEIVKTVNAKGCRTRVRYQRDKDDRTKIIKRQGGGLMTVKAMQKLIKSPRYAGINVEKWTNGDPTRFVFKGLVDVNLFNKANLGEKVIVEGSDGDISIHTKKPAERYQLKGTRNADFAYRKFVTCPTCNNKLLGSASRGKSGKHYAAYHCSHYGHYYRIPKDELENMVTAFITNLTISSDALQSVLDAVAAEWHLRNQGQLQALQDIDNRIKELQNDASTSIDKIRVLNSPTAIKFMEEDLVRIEKQIEELAAEKARKEVEQPANLERVLGRVKYFVEHLDELLIQQIDPVKKAQLFGLLFDKMPSVEDLNCGTQNSPLFTGVNPLFALAKMKNNSMVTLPGIEPGLQG